MKHYIQMVTFKTFLDKEDKIIVDVAIVIACPV